MSKTECAEKYKFKSIAIGSCKNTLVNVLNTKFSQMSNKMAWPKLWLARALEDNLC